MLATSRYTSCTETADPNPPACILARLMPLQMSSPPRLHSGPRALVAAPTSVPGGMILLCPARFPRSQAFALPAICALASNASLSSHLALPRPSPAAASASGTPLPPSSSPPSHALFAGIPAAAAAVLEIPLRPPALNLCLSPRSPQLLAVRRPSRASYPHRSRRRPRIASPAFSCFGYLGLSTAVTTPLVVCQ